MKLKFLGGARTVTGSCFYIECNDLKILVDCGMHQGEDADEVNRAVFEFQPEDIDYVFITHAHIDHSGMLPRVVKEGFQGRIITTSATRDLLEMMLYDSANIQENDAAWLQEAVRPETCCSPLLQRCADVIPLLISHMTRYFSLQRH
jgi:metallo-beta-lactamase family protein